MTKKKPIAKGGGKFADTKSRKGAKYPRVAWDSASHGTYVHRAAAQHKGTRTAARRQAKAAKHDAAPLARSIA
jgi:hypothetical protein